MPKIVIDGYNLLAQSTYATRELLVAALKRYRNQERNDVIVFFDGTHKGSWFGDKQIEEHIEIVFSPMRVTADDMIEEYIEQFGHLPLIVISSDRRIQKAASARGLPFLESIEFLRKLHSIAAQHPSPDLPWNEGRKDEDDQNPTRKDKKGNPRQKSKKEKLKAKTLKKI